MYKFTAEDIKGFKVGDRSSGVAILSNYELLVSKKGTKYITGTLTAGASIGIVVWSSSPAFAILAEEMDKYLGKVVLVDFDVVEFSGRATASLTRVEINNEYSKGELLEQRYSKEAYIDFFYGILDRNVSQAGQGFITRVFDTSVESLKIDMNTEEGVTIGEQFFNSFCATSHHDNCVSGLLAHTAKMLYITECLCALYPWLANDSDGFESAKKKDLLFTLVTLHDIGKIKEMVYGVYQEETYNTHRVVGLEILYNFKDDFIELYGVHGWNILQSVIVGHHDEFEDKARTVLAYIVSKIDFIESKFTEIGQLIESETFSGVSGESIKLGDRHLHI